MELLLVAAGSVFALLFVINLIIQTIRSVPKIGFPHLLLAFLVTLIPVVALIQNQLRDEPLRVISGVAIGIGVLVIIPSLIVLVLDLRRPQRLEGSRGVLGIGVGILVIVSVFSVPLTAEIQLGGLDNTPTPIIVLAANSPESTVAIGAGDFTRTLPPTPSSTLTATGTPTRRPQPTLTATATRFQFSTRTPVPTATLPNPCLALTLYNINLRAEPDTESALLTTIPYDLTVTVFGRNADSTWWYVRYEDQTGWLDGQFLTLSASCADLPERAP